MDIIERLPTFTDKELANLLGNASRLETSGTAKQQTMAQELLPLIHAEVAGRKAAKPKKAKAVRAKKVTLDADGNPVPTAKRAARKPKAAPAEEADEGAPQEL